MILEINSTHTLMHTHGYLSNVTHKKAIYTEHTTELPMQWTHMLQLIVYNDQYPTETLTRSLSHSRQIPTSSNQYPICTVIIQKVNYTTRAILNKLW